MQNRCLFCPNDHSERKMSKSSFCSIFNLYSEMINAGDECPIVFGDVIPGLKEIVQRPRGPREAHGQLYIQSLPRNPYVFSDFYIP